MLNKIKANIFKYLHGILNSEATTILLFSMCCLLLVFDFIGLFRHNHVDSSLLNEISDNNVLGIYQYKVRLNNDFLPENVVYNSRSIGSNIAAFSPTPTVSRFSQEIISSTPVTPSLTPVITTSTTTQDTASKSNDSAQSNKAESNNALERDKNLNIRFTSKSTVEGRDRDRELIFKLLVDNIEEYEFYYDKFPEIYVDKSETLLSDDPSSVIYFYNGTENKTNAMAINLGSESYMFIRVEACNKVVFEDYLIPLEYNIESKYLTLCMESGNTKVNYF
ncbi:MAG: hypothetical protein KatS3mg084_0207 [Candidatus Dojkabacteria bacterium]|nr:MAG: hypothetical protein KatS3mg084_0207 [Candidatus Dojkabacteria bacterium]